MPKKEEAKVDLNELFEEEIILCYVEFYDLAYSPGWNVKAGYPTLRDAHQVGCGVLVAEDKDTYTIAQARGKNVNGDDVLNPLIIFKSLITEMVTFTKVAFGDGKQKKGKMCVKKIYPRR